MIKTVYRGGNLMRVSNLWFSLLVLFAILVPLGLAGCKSGEDKAVTEKASNQAMKEQAAQPESQKANYVFTNGKVYTVNPDQEWAQAVAVTGNKISFVGDDEGAVELIGPDTQVIDLNGKMLLPGFVSAHDHLIAARWMNYGVDLYPAKTKEEYLALIKEYVEANPDEKVIRGIGWNPALYGGHPTAEELDAVVSDRPAILLEFTIHDGWLNTKALEVGNITKDTPDPVPGVTYWVRDSEGNPTGTGIEFAWLPAFIASGAWQPETMIPESMNELHKAAVESGMTTYLTPGPVTPRLNDGMGSLEDFAVIMDLLTEIDNNGELKLRSFIQPLYKNPDADPEEFAAASAELAEKYNTDRVRAFGMKIHPEGNWSSRTSLMLEPYLPEEGSVENLERPSPTSYGAAAVDGELMKQVVLAANAKGLDVNTHVDGSQTVRNKIDAIQAAREAGYTDARNQLSHLFWTHPDDLKRIFEMDIPVNVSPNFTTDWSGQDILALSLLGEERAREQYAMYPKVIANGNKVSISADIPSGPIEHIGPLFQMQTAMTLKDPTNPDSKAFPPGREGITLEQAIQAVTVNPAWQIRMEDKIGSIEIGKYADLVVLEENLFDKDAMEIADVRVLMTMMDGKITYRAGD